MKKIIEIFLAFCIFSTICFAQGTRKFELEQQRAPELHVATGHNGRVNSIAWSKNGEYIASVGVDGTMRLWDAESGKEIKKITNFENPRCVSWNADGKTLAIFDKNTIFIFDIYSESILKKIALQEDYPEGGFNFNGSKLLAKNGDIDIFETKTYTKISTIKKNSKEIHYALWSPNGKYIATLDEDNILSVYNVTQTNPIRIASWKADYITGLCWSGDGKYILSNNNVYDAFTGTSILNISADCWGSSWSPDGKYIAMSTNNVLNYSELSVFDAKTGKELYSHENSGTAIGCENWSPDGKYLAIAGRYDDCYFEIIDIATGKKKIDLGINRPYLDYAYMTNDNSLFFTVDTGKMLGDKNGSISVWNAAIFEKQFSIECSPRSYFAISPDKNTLVFENIDGNLQFYDLKNGKVVKIIETKYDLYDWIEPNWSPDGKYVIVKKYPVLEIYSASTKVLLKEIDGYELSFTSDGKFCAVAGSDFVKIYNTGNWTEYKNIKLAPNYEGKEESVNAISWNHSDTRIAIGTTSKLMILNVHTWKIENLIFDKSDYASRLVWSNDDKFLVTNGNFYGMIYVWNSLNGNLLNSIDTKSIDFVTSLTFTNDGKRLISTTGNGSIQNWDFATGELLAESIIGMNEEWVTYTSEGYFIGSSWAADNFLYTVDDMKVYPLDSMYETYFRPDIIAAKLRGEKVNATSFSALLSTGEAPLVQFTSTPASTQSRDITVNFSVQDAGGGIGAVYLSLNGKVIQLQAASRKFTLEGAENVAPQNHTVGKNVQFSHTVSLSSGENIIEAYATNEAGVIESRHAQAKVSWQGATAKPNLYVLAVGVNKYRDRSLWLNYAVPDATSIADSFKNVRGNLYQSVNVVTIFDADVTAGGISTAFNSLAPKVGVDDVFIFYLSGHGTTYTDGDYYFIPVDFRFRNADSIPESAISKHFITENLSKIKAQKSLVMLDTCNSGAFISTGARGMAEKTAIDRLSRATGQATIAASSDTQSAMEGYEGHGIFTYVILEGLSGKADTNKDGYISLSELSAYAEEKVPDYSYSKWGYEQYPQIDLRKQSNFPLVGK